MAAVVARAPDLLAWPEVKAAEERAREAQAEWARARWRAHYAPHGKRAERVRALSEASAAALRATLELQRLRGEAS